jgi:hypothetical protein
LGTGTHWAAIVTTGAAVVAALGVFLVLVQIRDGRRSRDAQITADISRRWDEDAVLAARNAVNALGTPERVRDELAKHYAAKDATYYRLLCEANYFEDLAVLCERKALDKAIIRESLGIVVTSRYKRWHLAVDWIRHIEGTSESYAHFEALADEMATPPKRRISDWLREPAFLIRWR